MLAFRTPFVDHGGIAMAGELPVMGGPLGPRTSGGGLDGFPVAGRRRTNTVAAELDHFLQLPVRGGVDCSASSGSAQAINRRNSP